jgi:hypothetical protein
MRMGWAGVKHARHTGHPALDIPFGLGLRCERQVIEVDPTRALQAQHPDHVFVAWSYLGCSCPFSLVHTSIVSHGPSSLSSSSFFFRLSKKWLCVKAWIWKHRNDILFGGLQSKARCEKSTVTNCSEHPQSCLTSDGGSSWHLWQTMTPWLDISGQRSCESSLLRLRVRGKVFRIFILDPALFGF